MINKSEVKEKGKERASFEVHDWKVWVDDDTNIKKTGGFSFHTTTNVEILSFAIRSPPLFNSVFAYILAHAGMRDCIEKRVGQAFLWSLLRIRNCRKYTFSYRIMEQMNLITYIIVYLSVHVCCTH
jgi:hypothetical protein